MLVGLVVGGVWLIVFGLLFGGMRENQGNGWPWLKWVSH